MANFSKFIACSFYLSNMYGRKAQNWLSYVLLALHMAPARMVWVSSIRISIALVIRTQSSHDCFSHKSKKSFGLGLLSEAKHSQPLYSLPAHFPPVSSALLMGIFQRAVRCSPCCIQPGDTQKQACFRELPTSLLTHLYHSSWLPSLTWQRAGSVYTGKYTRTRCEGIQQSVMHAATSRFPLIAPFVLRDCHTHLLQRSNSAANQCANETVVLLIPFSRNWQRTTASCAKKPSSSARAPIQLECHKAAL